MNAKETIITPPRVAMGVARWAGEKTIGGARLGTDTISRLGGTARTWLESPQLGHKLLAEHLQNKLSATADNIAIFRADAATVRQQADEYVSVAIMHAREVGQGIEPPSQDYLDQIERVLQEGHVAPEIMDETMGSLRKRLLPEVEVEQV